MNIHFIGISGIGISALAGYYLKKGHKITGSCIELSETALKLEKKGVKIFIGHKSSNILPKTDLVVYTVAVKKDNPEIKESKRRKIKTLCYAEALGLITKENYTIGISGTHGKSTTTAMLSLIAIFAKLDPTIIVGTKMKELGGNNYRVGKSNLLIIEADEYNRSFLNHDVDIAIVNNIERDHLDCYKNLNDIINTFKKYIKKIKNNGILILNKDDKNVLKLRKTRKDISLIEFSIKDKEAKKIKKILKVPGEYNVYNALAALYGARALKIEDRVSFKALSNFKGVWRRFEEKKSKDFILVNDYAHHPTALRAVLKSAKERYKNKKVWAIFQPHQIQRTFLMFDEFLKTLKEAKLDKIIITDIYSVLGREKKEFINKTSSKILVEKTNKKNVIYLKKEDIKEFIKKNRKEIDILFIIGAGDIYEFGKELIK